MLDELHVLETKIETRVVTEYSWLCPKCSTPIKREKRPIDLVLAHCNYCKKQYKKEYETRKMELRAKLRLERRWEIAKANQVLVSEVYLSEIKIPHLEFHDDTDLSVINGILPNGSMVSISSIYCDKMRIFIDNRLCVSEYTLDNVGLNDKHRADIDKVIEEELNDKYLNYNKE